MKKTVFIFATMMLLILDGVMVSEASRGTFLFRGREERKLNSFVLLLISGKYYDVSRWKLYLKYATRLSYVSTKLRNFSFPWKLRKFAKNTAFSRQCIPNYVIFVRTCHIIPANEIRITFSEIFYHSNIGTRRKLLNFTIYAIYIRTPGVISVNDETQERSSELNDIV